MLRVAYSPGDAMWIHRFPSIEEVGLKQNGAVVLVLMLTGCEMLTTPRDVMGNFDVTYVDNLRIYIDGELIAEAESGENATVSWNGESFEISQVCSDEGVQCPGESYWREIGADQPQGTSSKVLNFVNLDEERGELGQRMGGLMQDDGSFDMLSGLVVNAGANCLAIGVGAVTGNFTAENDAVVEGVVAFQWNAGCQIAGVEIGGELRLETDYTATRTGDLDLSSVPEDADDTAEGDVTF